MLSVIVLSVILSYVILLSVILSYVILLGVILIYFILIYVILLSVILINVILLCVILICHYSFECHSVLCPDLCHSTQDHSNLCYGSEHHSNFCHSAEVILVTINLISVILLNVILLKGMAPNYGTFFYGAQVRILFYFKSQKRDVCDATENYLRFPHQNLPSVNAAQGECKVRTGVMLGKSTVIDSG
jgi:hypothetical protein